MVAAWWVSSRAYSSGRRCSVSAMSQVFGGCGEQIAGRPAGVGDGGDQRRPDGVGDDGFGDGRAEQVVQFGCPGRP